MTIPKFRAWNRIERKMYELEGMFWGHEFDIRPEGKPWEEGRVDDYIILRPTGTHDLAERAIYEGDILVDRENNLCRITWDKDLGFRKSTPHGIIHQDISWKSNPLEVPLYVEGWTIVGNWFENKSLFERYAKS